MSCDPPAVSSMEYLAWSKGLQYLLDEWTQSLALPDILGGVTCATKLLTKPGPKDTNNILSRWRMNYGILGSWTWYASSLKMDISHHLGHGKKRIIASYSD